MDTSLFPAIATTARRRCPRCGCARSHRWGRFSNRQRYRCLACQRTFSTFTGTALHYLKRIDRWDGFCLAMQRTETVRGAAVRLEVHRDTVFRWRHRFLAALDRGESVLLSGQVAAGMARFRFTRKGARQPHPRTVAGVALEDVQVWVALARDQRGAALSDVRISAGVGVTDLFEALRGRVAPGAVLRSSEGLYSRTAICARRMQLRFEPLRRHSESPSDPEQIVLYALRIKRWMTRFRGTATRYLPHYLVWFRTADAGWRTDRWDWSAVAPTSAR